MQRRAASSETSEPIKTIPCSKPSRSPKRGNWDVRAALAKASRPARNRAGRARLPPLTRVVALQLGTSRSYDMTPAQRDYGYRKIVSTDAKVDALVGAPDRPSHA
ncbi:MAG: hypothetical protein JNN27_04460 [Planctomycetes bacterium]|nr:hypothetical protein [Planctomycetota bacterium]